MIELLAAAALTATGVVGGFYLQNRNYAYEQDLASSMHAELSIRNLTRMMDANPRGLSAYHAGFGSPPVRGKNCWLGTCTPEQLAKFHLAHWKCQLGAWSDHAACRKRSRMPVYLSAGDGRLQHTRTSVSIVLRWRPTGSRQPGWRQLERRYAPFPLSL